MAAHRIVPRAVDICTAFTRITNGSGWYILKFRVFDLHVKGKQDVPSRRPKVGFILHAHHVLGKVAEGRINQAVNGNTLFTVPFTILQGPFFTMLGNLYQGFLWK